ncbi:MAG: hypothetical protein WD208_00375 [Dehalococcoidia bacterium]
MRHDNDPPEPGPDPGPGQPRQDPEQKGLATMVIGGLSVVLVLAIILALVWFLTDGFGSNAT